MTLSMRGCHLFLMALVGLMPWAAHAQHADAHMAMAAAQTGPTLGADAAFGPQGRLWVVTAHDGYVLLRHSDNFGRAFSAPVKVNPIADNIAAQRENAPKIAIGPNNQLYVSWVHPMTKKWTSEVRFARSTDGGTSFSRPITIDDGPAETTHSFNALAVAGNGDVVVAWLDGRTMASAMAEGKSHRGLALYYSWSANDGASFAPNRRLMDHTCECCRIALARAPDGHIAAFFRGIFGNNIRDHAFGVLRTGGGPLHWQRATWSQWRVAACPEQGPGLAIGRHGVRHAVWYEASHGPTIWYGQLHPGHPPMHQRKIGGGGASHADVAIQGRTVWVAWNQVSKKGYALMLRVSHDDGVDFAPAHVIATAARGVASPQLLVHDGKAYVAWNTIGGFRLIRAEQP